MKRLALGRRAHSPYEVRRPALELALEPVLVAVHPSPESLPRALHAAPAAPAGSASASRSEKSPSPSVERLGGAYAPRTQLQRAQIRGDDAGAHIAVAVRRPEGGRLK